MTAEPPSVTCVVLNWNGWQDTVACVQSLLLQDYEPLHILVVDNRSTDDSVERLRRACPQVEVVVADANRGFAAGCNVGIRLAMARGASFVWLLNNDTIAPPDTLRKLVGAAAVDASVGIVGSVLMHFEQREHIQVWGGGTVRRGSGYSRHLSTAAALGPESFLTFASVLIRREVFITAGLLDEGFFMYYEDADFCFRARDRQWKFAVAEGTAVLHKEGGSTRKRKKAVNDRVITASGLRFLQRHGRPVLGAQVLFLVLRLGRRLRVLDLAGVKAVLLGVWDWRKQPSQQVLAAGDKC